MKDKITLSRNICKNINLLQVNGPQVKNSNRHMKRCSTSLIIREVQIKTTMKHNLTSVRTTIIKKSTSNKCWRGCREKGALLHCWSMIKKERKKEDMVLEYNSAIKKNKSNAICSNIDAARDYHTKWTKKEKDKYNTISLICRT